MPSNDKVAVDWDALEIAVERLAGFEKAESEEDKRWKDAVEYRIRTLRELIQTRSALEDLPGQETIDSDLEEGERTLAAARELDAPEPVHLNEAKEVEPYQKDHETAQARRDKRQSDLDALKARIEAAEEELKGLPARELEAKKRVEALTKDDDYTKYRVDSLKLELAVVKERRDGLKVAVGRWGMQRPAYQRKLDAAKLEFAFQEKRYALARDEAARLSEAEKLRMEREAARGREEARLADDPIHRVKKLLGAETKERLSSVATLKTEERELSDEVSSRSDYLKLITREQEHLVQRLDLKGEGTASLLGQTLDRTERSLRLLQRRALPNYRAAAEKNQRALVGILDRLWEIQLPLDESADFRELLDGIPEEREAEARAVFREASFGLLDALRAQQDARRRIAASYDAMGIDLAKTERELKDLLTFLRERIYWSQSGDPITGKTFGKARKELPGIGTYFADPEIYEGFRQTFRERPVESILAALLIAVLGVAVLFVPLFLRRRARRQPAAPETGIDAWRVEVGRTLLAVARAGLSPLALVTIAGLLRALHSQDAMSLATPHLLERVAVWLLVWRLSAQLLSSRGVAVRRLNLPGDVAAQIHRSVSITAVAGILLDAPATVLRADPFRLESMPLLLETAGHAAFVVALGLLVRVRGALIQRITRPGRSLRKLWYVITPLLLLVFAAVLVMDVLGYREGARHVLWNSIWTAVSILLLGALYAMLVRGVDAIATAVRRRTLKEGSATEAWESWERVRDQLTRIVATVVMVIAVIALMRFWSSDWFMLGQLDEIRLVEVSTDRWLTLWDVLIAIFWIAGGHFLMHNLSALYEFAVVPIVGKASKGGRYVFLALSRYLILLVTYGAALVTLGLDYSKLAWLATALSVGIGFGLQEIVANFISGLILLVERPIRVGDTVTVGQMEGVVEKISMRATTLLNWDKQTIVLPNKDFITKELTNWTRGEDVMRRKILVGVAYGTDLEKLLKILEETVKGHDKVLSSPPPRFFFRGFGESSLDFDIWIYTRISDGLKTRSDLYFQIHDRLREEKISIPFPQRDLHHVSGPGALTGGVPEQVPTLSGPPVPADADAPDAPDAPEEMGG